MTSAQSTITDDHGRQLYAWWIGTDYGRKTIWAASACEARDKAERAGFRVAWVVPRATLP